jgi:hypothetical protein
MSQELHYTSAPRGLKPGSRGFCTVATTPNLSRPLAERLEGLSGYQPVYPPGDPSAALNPVVRAHVKVSVAGRQLHVLSRIGPAGLDYSSRPNKYAHHVVLELGERPSAGPAWLLAQPGFLEAAWIGEPRVLPAGRVPPAGDRFPGIAYSWQARTGDAGWAGVLAEAFLADPRRPAYLVFQPGMELLPLFEEALALLPASRRWDVEFSTYFTHLPQGISCSWRGVLDGSDEAHQAARLPGALVIGLSGTRARAQGGALVQLARTGQHVNLPDAFDGMHPLAESGVDMFPPPPIARGPRASHQPASSVATELIPEMAALMKPEGSHAFSPRSMRTPRRHKQVRILIAALAIASLLPLAVAAYFMSKLKVETVAGLPKIAKIGGERPGPSVPADAPRIPETPTRASRTEPRRAIPSNPPAENPSPVALATGTTDAVAIPPRAPAGLTPAPPEPKIQNTPPKEPLARFFAIPMNPASGLDSVRESERIRRIEKDIRTVDILTADNKRLDVQRPGDREITIRTKSNSVTYDAVEVAKIKYGKRDLTFDWGKNLQNETEAASEVLDAILSIRCVDGDNLYMLLRNLEIRNERGALALRRYSAKPPKPRTWLTNWAEEDGLKSTKRQFLIRRWQVAFKLRDEPPPFVVGSRAGIGPTPSDEQRIITDEVSLKLRIDSHDPWNIYVGFELSPRLKENLARLETRLTELEARYYFGDRQSRDLGERAQRLTRRLDEELKHLRSLDARDRLNSFQDRPLGDERQDEIRRIKADMADLEKTLEGASGLFLLGERVRASSESKLELSVIICLKLESGTVVDVARFGEFATPEK